MITSARMEILGKAKFIPLPKQGADLNNLVTISYLLACVMSNGERGVKADDKLAGLAEKQKQTITGYLFPTTTAKMATAKKLGETILKDPGQRFDGMKAMIQDQEKVGLQIENPFDLFTYEELDTLQWSLSQIEEQLSDKCDQRSQMAYTTFKNFLKLMVKIESDKDLYKRRWGIQKKKEQIEKIQQRVKFMYLYQSLKQKRDLENELDAY